MFNEIFLHLRNALIALGCLSILMMLTLVVIDKLTEPKKKPER